MFSLRTLIDKRVTTQQQTQEIHIYNSSVNTLTFLDLK